MSYYNHSFVTDLEIAEIDQVGGAELTGGELSGVGAAALQAGATVAVINPAIGAAIMAAGATAVLFGAVMHAAGD